MPVATAHNALNAGPDWWRLLGALVAVLALLVLGLKLLQRLQGARGAAGASAVLAVHRLSPGRTLELVRWQQSVFVIYRSDASAVLLREEPFDPARHLPASADGGPWRRLLGRDGPATTRRPGQ